MIQRRIGLALVLIYTKRNHTYSRNHVYRSQLKYFEILLMKNFASPVRKETLGTDATTKRVATAPHLPTSWRFEPAKRPVARADHCLVCSFHPQCEHCVLIFTAEWAESRAPTETGGRTVVRSRFNEHCHRTGRPSNGVSGLREKPVGSDPLRPKSIPI